jgi:hypothetical protein
LPTFHWKSLGFRLFTEKWAPVHYFPFRLLERCCCLSQVHTGHGRGYGLEKRSAATSDDERDPIWLYAGTPLFDAIIAFRRLVDLESVPQAIAGLQGAIGIALSSPIAKRLAEEQAAAQPPSTPAATTTRECAAPY